MNVFKPSEWRWKLGEVCDNQWHHYAVSVDYPKVTLEPVVTKQPRLNLNYIGHVVLGRQAVLCQ